MSTFTYGKKKEQVLGNKVVENLTSLTLVYNQSKIYNLKVSLNIENVERKVWDANYLKSNRFLAFYQDNGTFC